MSDSTRGWWGRVFGNGEIGGNHTVIITDADNDVDEFALARRLRVPDTGFARLIGPRSIELATYSPIEELAQCIQTSLAAVVALDAAEGEQWRVRHRLSDPLTLVRYDNVVWAEHWIDADCQIERIEMPGFLNNASLSGSMILRQLRSRVYVECEDSNYLETMTVNASEVLGLCRSYGVNGLVLSARQGDVLRVRVFTSSLGGSEDAATGGAVLGLGQILAIRGTYGEVSVVQGPRNPESQGHFRLRVDGPTQIHLGGQVSSLLAGRVLA